MIDQIEQDYVGRQITEYGAISKQRYSEILATFGWKRRTMESDLLPQLCHWCAFSPIVATDELGEDGHPDKGSFLPDLGLKRRMWASGKLKFIKSLHVDEELTRIAVIEKVELKEGSSGRMAFVTVSSKVSGENGLAISESQNIVYLDMPKTFEPPAKQAMPELCIFKQRFFMPSTRLFRFSAITFNAHRIHFDLPYAQDVEKYPGLVVHGPMQAMILAKAASEYSRKPLRSFQFRGVHPCFHFDDFVICAEPPNEVGSLSMFAGVCNGHQTMKAKATW